MQADKKQNKNNNKQIDFFFFKWTRTLLMQAYNILCSMSNQVEMNITVKDKV